MLFLITSAGNGKRNLVTALLLTVVYCRFGYSQSTVTFNNNAGGHIWNNNNNWDTTVTPTAVDTAVIPTGLASQTAFYLTNNSASASASVGSLLFNAPTNNYPFVRPATANRDVTLTFGNTSTPGVLKYATVSSGQGLTFGANPADSFGTLTFQIPKGLDVQMDPTHDIYLSTTIVSGAGSLNVGTVSYTRLGSGDATADLRGINGSFLSPAAFNTYGGVTTINSGVTLVLGASSTVGSLGILRGPLGLATCTLNGGTITTHNPDGGASSIELHNAIDVRANSAIFTHGETNILGNVRTGTTNGAQRLTLHIKNPLTFDNAG